jgi:manganese-dependent inorganic pyrophosphatase
VETVDLADFHARELELLAAIVKIKEEGAYHSVILFITDIIKEGSKFFVSTDDVPGVTKALGKHLENNTAWVEGIVSRKKQVVPMFTAIFD